MLPLPHAFAQPAEAIARAGLPTERSHATVQDAKIGPDKDIPHRSVALIHKYVSDLRVLGLLD
jgi:fatty acid CoA ligase FadD9